MVIIAFIIFYHVFHLRFLKSFQASFCLSFFIVCFFIFFIFHVFHSSVFLMCLSLLFSFCVVFQYWLHCFFPLSANDTKTQWLQAGSSTLWSVLSILGPGGRHGQTTEGQKEAPKENEEHGQTRARAREGQKGAPGRSKWGAYFKVIFEKNQKIQKTCFLFFHCFSA